MKQRCAHQDASSRRGIAGFTLLELLIALTMGLVVSLSTIEVLHASTVLTARLARQIRQQEFAQRTRRLVESDLRRAESMAPGPVVSACNLAGRTPVLQFSLGRGLPPIIYSRGTPPSPIWGGEVLMRCGPAFGLDGSLNLNGSWQNRVVIDELMAQSALLSWLERLSTLQL